MPSVQHKIKRYGWVADTSDQRDHLYAAPIELTKLPPKVDLRPQCPKVTTMPYPHFANSNLAEDFWTIRVVAH